MPGLWIISLQTRLRIAPSITAFLPAMNPRHPLCFSGVKIKSAALVADVRPWRLFERVLIMVKPSRPKSNLERQRAFRARHPGYRNRFRAGCSPAQVQAQLAAALAAATAEIEALRRTELEQPRLEFTSA
jgi:hypothetical protein